MMDRIKSLLKGKRDEWNANNFDESNYDFSDIFPSIGKFFSYSYRVNLISIFYGTITFHHGESLCKHVQLLAHISPRKITSTVCAYFPLIFNKIM